jgi:hypothetical protein
LEEERIAKLYEEVPQEPTQQIIDLHISNEDKAFQEVSLSEEDEINDAMKNE